MSLQYDAQFFLRLSVSISDVTVAQSVAIISADRPLKAAADEVIVE